MLPLYCQEGNRMAITDKAEGKRNLKGKGDSMSEEMNNDEIKVVKNSTIYEIRLMVDSNEKETYTKDEILKLLDTIARAKETE